MSTSTGRDIIRGIGNEVILLLGLFSANLRIPKLNQKRTSLRNGKYLIVSKYFPFLRTSVSRSNYTYLVSDIFKKTLNNERDPLVTQQVYNSSEVGLTHKHTVHLVNVIVPF